MPDAEVIHTARRHIRTLQSNPVEATGDPSALEAFQWLLSNFSSILTPPESGHFPAAALASGRAVRRRSWASGSTLSVIDGQYVTSPRQRRWQMLAADAVATDWEVVR